MNDASFLTDTLLENKETEKDLTH